MLDLDAAEREAVMAAAEIGRDMLAFGKKRDVVIEVRNEHEQRVLTATVEMRVVRDAPPPKPAG